MRADGIPVAGPQEGRVGHTLPQGMGQASPATAYASTSTGEKVLLALIIITLPLESHLLIIPGFSVQFVMFGMVGLYLLLSRPSALLKTVGQPVFLAAYAFLVFSAAMEATAPHASYGELTRIAQMIMGAILIASICRDLAALRVALFAYLVAGLWLSILLFVTSYSTVKGMTSSTFEEASRLRAEAFSETPIEANINGMAFLAGQGAVVALSFALRARSLPVRNAFLGLGLFCMIGAFLPLSRGGVAIAVISCASVMYGFGLRHAKTLLVAILLGIAVFAVVPQAVWSRMSFSFEERDGKMEGRARVYKAAIDHLSDYILAGVGSGNYWSTWGRRTAFGENNSRVSGAHNSFLQVTLYWGVGGLLALLLIFWQAYRCLPSCAHREAASLSLLGLSVSLLLYAQVVHNLYAKEFCLGLGLLAGAHCWIWPKGIVPRA